MNEHDAQTRHIYLDVPHSDHLKPSWYGESVGHFEDGTLVVDTIGLNDRDLRRQLPHPAHDTIACRRAFPSDRWWQNTAGRHHNRRSGGLQHAMVRSAAMEPARNRPITRVDLRGKQRRVFQLRRETCSDSRKFRFLRSSAAACLTLRPLPAPRPVMQLPRFSCRRQQQNPQAAEEHRDRHQQIHCPSTANAGRAWRPRTSTLIIEPHASKSMRPADAGGAYRGRVQCCSKSGKRDLTSDIEKSGGENRCGERIELTAGETDQSKCTSRRRRMRSQAPDRNRKGRIENP